MKNQHAKVLVSLIAAGGILLGFGVSPAQAQRVIEFEEIIVEGRIQKPEAFYILQHANLNYETLNPKPSFLEELLESVEDEPF